MSASGQYKAAETDSRLVWNTSQCTSRRTSRPSTRPVSARICCVKPLPDFDTVQQDAGLHGKFTQVVTRPRQDPRTPCVPRRACRTSVWQSRHRTWSSAVPCSGSVARCDYRRGVSGQSGQQPGFHFAPQPVDECSASSPPGSPRSRRALLLRPCGIFLLCSARPQSLLAAQPVNLRSLSWKRRSVACMRRFWAAPSLAVS